jgi:hypothetical protein
LRTYFCLLTRQTRTDYLNVWWPVASLAPPFKRSPYMGVPLSIYTSD